IGEHTIAFTEMADPDRRIRQNHRGARALTGANALTPAGDATPADPFKRAEVATPANVLTRADAAAERQDPAESRREARACGHSRVQSTPSTPHGEAPRYPRHA